MPERDKTKEYITEHETYNIVMFWHPGKKDAYSAGWVYRVVEK